MHQEQESRLPVHRPVPVRAPLADAKKLRALEEYAMDAAVAY